MTTLDVTLNGSFIVGTAVPADQSIRPGSERQNFERGKKKHSLNLINLNQCYFEPKTKQVLTQIPVASTTSCTFAARNTNRTKASNRSILLSPRPGICQSLLHGRNIRILRKGGKCENVYDTDSFRTSKCLKFVQWLFWRLGVAHYGIYSVLSIAAACCESPPGPISGLQRGCVEARGGRTVT